MNNWDFAMEVWQPGSGSYRDYQLLDGKLYFCPQTSGGVQVGVAMPQDNKAVIGSVTLMDTEIDDIITVMSYYKQLRQEHGVWEGN